MLNGLAHAARCFAHDESAATAVEYSLIAAGVALAIVSVVWGLGSGVNEYLYDKIKLPNQ
jgi:pilus assembly protein Flp/PilA